MVPLASGARLAHAQPPCLFAPPSSLQHHAGGLARGTRTLHTFSRARTHFTRAHDHAHERPHASSELPPPVHALTRAAHALARARTRAAYHFAGPRVDTITRTRAHTRRLNFHPLFMHSHAAHAYARARTRAAYHFAGSRVDTLTGSLTSTASTWHAVAARASRMEEITCRSGCYAATSISSTPYWTRAC